MPHMRCLLLAGPLASAILFSIAFGQNAPPTLEKVEPLHRAVRLTWSFTGNQNPASFRIYRSIRADNGFEVVQQIPGVDRNKLDYWLDNGTVYYYRLTAIDRNGNESGFSNTEMATPAARPPEIFSITPNQGANDALVVIRDLSGNNFAPGDSVKLLKAGAVDIIAQKVQVVQPDQIIGELDLRERSAGSYDVALVRLDTMVQLPKAFTVTASHIRFAEVSATAGLQPNNFLSFGSAWGDYDNDGWLDLFVANEEASNHLFHNDSASFKLFAGADTVAFGGASGVAWIDYDNDHDLDLFIGSLGDAKCLLQNRLIQEGRVHFEPVGERMHLRDFSIPSPQITGASWADYDQDGKLDLYLTDNSDDPDKLNRLYRNQDSIFFQIKPDEIGADLLEDTGYSPIWADYDNDGDPDLYVCNGKENRLYRNLGDSRFKDVAADIGVNFPHHTENAAWGDYDNDGDLDLYIVNTNNEPNVLYQNNGNGTFQDATTTPLNDTGYGFAAAWGDYDNDGDLDLFLARGGFRETDLRGLRGQISFLFRNDFNRFVDVADNAGLADSLVATAAIWGDYDNDGFLDLFVAVRDTRFRNNPAFSSANKLYRNQGGNGNSWIKVQLRGTISNGAGIGARIELHTGNKLQIREINGGEGRSHQGVIAHFGLGTAASYDSIKVRWPSGIEQIRRSQLRIKDTLWIREPNLPRPTGLVAQARNGEVVLNWRDNRAGTDIVAFNLYRDKNFDPVTAQRIKEDYDSTRFTDTAVTNGITYTYWVRGIDRAKNLSRISLPDSATPKQPCGETVRVGDFVAPCGAIDVNDLLAFAEVFGEPRAGVLSSALKSYDIGPASGEPPHLIPQPDGKIDFEDLVVFVQMWRGDLQSRSFQIFGNQEIPAAGAKNAFVEIQKIDSDNKDETFELVLKLKGRWPVSAGQFQIVYDANEVDLQKIEPGEAFLLDGKPPLFLEHENAESGIAVVMISCERDSEEQTRESLSGSPSLLRLQLHNRDAAVPEITIFYELHNVREGSSMREKIVISLSAIPQEVMLSPNYPNPFNPSTHIQYGLPKAERVRLSIFDVLGQKIVTLVDEQKLAGFHSVEWDGFTGDRLRVSSGVYFYKLEVGRVVKVKKMLYLQ